MLMDWRLANKVEIGQLFSEFAIRSAQFVGVNEYSLYAALMLSVSTSERVTNSEITRWTLLILFADSLRSFAAN